MLDLKTITARAKEAPRETTDVEVIFDAGLTARLAEFQSEQAQISDELEQIETDLTAELETLGKDRRISDGRPGKSRKVAEDRSKPLRARLDEIAGQVEVVEAEAAEFLVTFRFTALHGFEWADLCSHAAPRAGVPADAQRGYNVDDVTRAAATRSGVRLIEDGATVPVSGEEWASVWETLPGVEWNRIRDQLWYLNELATFSAREQAVIAARKVSAAREAATQTSPSTSGSTLDGLQGGSPATSPSTSTTTEAA